MQTAGLSLPDGKPLPGAVSALHAPRQLACINSLFSRVSLVTSACSAVSCGGRAERGEES
eukprot:2844214-Pleurochrysis_carterae.AAC.1